MNGYVRALALQLVERGHDVISLCSGNSYDTEAGSAAPGPCRAVRHPDWRAIRVFEMVNSPVLAPSLAQFHEAMGEISSPDLEAQVGALLERLSPDAIHFHSLEGLSIGTVDAARALPSHPRLISSLHNYHALCPQVSLMQGHRRPCHSFENGHLCTTCIPAADVGEERLFRATTQHRTGSGDPRDDGAFPVLTDEDACRPAPMGEPDRRGEASAIRLDHRPHLWSGVDVFDPGWDPLENVADPEPRSDRPPNDYARRRLAMVSMLNRCDRVLAVSTFVDRKFRAMGVDPGVLSMLHIGSPIVEIARSASTDAHGAAAPRARGPVRIAFLGYNNWYKGLPLLAAALELLPDDVLSRIHLSVFALGGDDPATRFCRVRSKVRGAIFESGYNHEELPGLLHSIDVGVVPSTWWDNAPQTVMEYLACGVPVLGAEVGGIPDFVQDGVNGWLFRANDPADLARRLSEIVSNPSSLPVLRSNVQPPKGMVQHAAELEQIYAGGFPSAV